VNGRGQVMTTFYEYAFLVAFAGWLVGFCSGVLAAWLWRNMGR
jgi:ABC-type lipoprotein release transport system permease subunit